MNKSFLQSKEWEEFQQSVGNKTFQIDDKLLIKKSLPLGKSYFYIPRATRQPEDFLNKVKEIAKREKAIFLKIEPIEELQLKTYDLKQVADVQPSKTLILDLTLSEEELLKNMHQKTRYNIRLASKKGVTICESKNIEDFWRLNKETTKRDGFRSHEKEHYEKMLKSEIIKLYIAKYENKIIASGIFVFYDDMVTYLHGASTHEYKNVMAPYLLHWCIIKLAKNKGFKYYDFYGIDEKKWPGVTRFKKGFSGGEVNYPGTFDVVFSRVWYYLYQIVREIRRFF